MSATLASYIAGRSEAGMPTRYDPARWMTASQPAIATRTDVSEPRSSVTSRAPCLREIGCLGRIANDRDDLVATLAQERATAICR